MEEKIGTPTSEIVLEKFKSFENADVGLISPLEFSPREAAAMKNSLIASGANMEISTGLETSLLFMHQFRNPAEQRGAAVSEILGMEKTIKLLDWCREKGTLGGSGKIGGRKGTEGTGLMQAAADLLTIAYFADRKEASVARERKILKLNQRIEKGLKRKFKDDSEKLKIISEKFAGISKPKDPSLLASIPPQSLAELWQFMIAQ